MMKAKEKLTAALNIIQNESVSVRLYIITRHLKEGVKEKEKIINKYRFQAHAVDMEEDLNKFFISIANKQISKMANDDGYELDNYTVIGDDLEDKVYTYALNNALSFYDVIHNQILQGKCPSISSLSDVNKDLWAYSIRFNIEDNVVYTFRKISKGKIVTDGPKTIINKVLLAHFDTSVAELKPVITETIRFDDKLDCLFSNEEFLVFKKSNFEQIVGLEEEFKEVASDVIETIAETNLVDNNSIELLKSKIDEERLLLKKLANIGKKGTHRKLNNKEIQKMNDTLEKVEGRKLTLSNDGKLILENTEDVNYFVKLLNDYYKQGLVSGKYYGTNSGQIINTVE